MSFNVVVEGASGDLGKLLHEKFQELYSDPAPGDHPLFALGVQTVNDFSSRVPDDGAFSVAISGHAHQGEEGSERDALSVSISPTEL